MSQQVIPLSPGRIRRPVRSSSRLRSAILAGSALAGLAVLIAAPVSAQSRAGVQVAARVVTGGPGPAAFDSVLRRLGPRPASAPLGLAEVRVVADSIDPKADLRRRVVRIDFLRN
jgi:hypothetical protein